MSTIGQTRQQPRSRVTGIPLTFQPAKFIKPSERTNWGALAAISADFMAVLPASAASSPGSSTVFSLKTLGSIQDLNWTHPRRLLMSFSCGSVPYIKTSPRSPQPSLLPRQRHAHSPPPHVGPCCLPPQPPPTQRWRPCFQPAAEIHSSEPFPQLGMNIS